MAAPVDTYLDLTAGVPHGLKNQNVAFVEKFTINAATVGVGAAAVLRLMNIPDKTQIEKIIMNVLTVEDSACVLDVGDYTISDDVAVDADGYFDALDAEVLGITSTDDGVLLEAAPPTFRAYEHGGKYYDDALRYLGVLFSAAADTVKVEVIVIGRSLLYVDA